MFRQVGWHRHKPLISRQQRETTCSRSRRPKSSEFVGDAGHCSVGLGPSGGATGGDASWKRGRRPGALLGAATFFLVGRSFAKWMTTPSPSRRLVMQVADSTRPEYASTRVRVRAQRSGHHRRDSGRATAIRSRSSARSQALAAMKNPQSGGSFSKTSTTNLNAGPRAQRTRGAGSKGKLP